MVRRPVARVATVVTDIRGAAVWRVGRHTTIPRRLADDLPAITALAQDLADECSAFAWANWHRVPHRPALWRIVRPMLEWSTYEDPDGVRHEYLTPWALLVELDTRPATRDELMAALASEIRLVADELGWMWPGAVAADLGRTVGA